MTIESRKNIVFDYRWQDTCVTSEVLLLFQNVFARQEAQTAVIKFKIVFPLFRQNCNSNPISQFYRSNNLSFSLDFLLV